MSDTSGSLKHTASGLVLTSERIVAAALKHVASGLVFSLHRPARHHEVIRALASVITKLVFSLHRPARLPDSAARLEQGFLTSNGRFVRRSVAEKIARATGQLTKPIIGGELTSEDLW